jgi:hypothetical protein
LLGQPEIELSRRRIVAEGEGLELRGKLLPQLPACSLELAHIMSGVLEGSDETRLEPRAIGSQKGHIELERHRISDHPR